MSYICKCMSDDRDSNTKEGSYHSVTEISVCQEKLSEEKSHKKYLVARRINHKSIYMLLIINNSWMICFYQISAECCLNLNSCSIFNRYSHFPLVLDQDNIGYFRRLFLQGIMPFASIRLFICWCSLFQTKNMNPIDLIKYCWFRNL